MKFNYDKKTLIITFIITILMLFVGIKFFKSFEISKGFWKYLSLFFSFFIILALILSYLFSPERVILGDKLIIYRIISKVYIDYSKIKEILSIDAKELAYSSTKLFGNSGVFGYYGKFQSNKLGIYYLYTRRINGNYVILKTVDKTYVLAPNDVDLFMKNLREKCNL